MVLRLTHIAIDCDSCELENVASLQLMLYCLGVALPYSQAHPWWSGMQKIKSLLLVTCCIYSSKVPIGTSLVLFMIQEMATNEDGSWVWLLPVCWLGFGVNFCLQSVFVISSGFGKTGCWWRQRTVVVLLHSCRCHILANLLLCNVRIWSKSCVGFEGTCYVKLSCIVPAA